MGNHMPKPEPNNSKSATEPITCLDVKFRWTGITGHCAEGLSGDGISEVGRIRCRI